MELEKFAVELNRHVVGIAVRGSGGFVFFSSDARFEGLDGKVFPRAKAIVQHLQRFDGKIAGHALEGDE